MEFGAVLRPGRANLERCLRAREEYLRARADHQQTRTRTLAEIEAKLSAARQRVFAAGDGVVKAEMTALEREWLRAAHSPAPELDLDRLWARVVPERWADRPRRGADLESVLALASDPEGVERAEEAAREVARRLVPFGVTLGIRIDWMVSREITFATRTEELFAAPAEAIVELATHEETQRAHRERLAARETLRATLDPLHVQTRNSSVPRELSFLAFAATLWNDASPRLPNAAPSPFEPALEIYRLGYALTAADDARVVLTSLPLVGG